MRILLLLLICCAGWTDGIIGRPAATANEYITQPAAALKAATEQAHDTEKEGSGSLLAWLAGAGALVATVLKMYTGSADGIAGLVFRVLSNKKERTRHHEVDQLRDAGERAIRAVKELPNDGARDKAVEKVMQGVPEQAMSIISKLLCSYK